MLYGRDKVPMNKHTNVPSSNSFPQAAFKASTDTFVSLHVSVIALVRAK
jgi:hypothetical protein